MLDIDPILILSIAIIFLLVLVILNSYFFTPLVKHMDDRVENIRKDLESAQAKSTNVEEMLGEANDTLVNAKNEAFKIKEEAYTKAKEVANTNLNKAKEELEFKSISFVKELEIEAGVLKQSLLDTMPQFKAGLKTKLDSI